MSRSEKVPAATPASGHGTPLRVLVALVVLESLALLVAGGAAIAAAFSGGALGMDLFLLAFAWGLAALLLRAARGLWAGERWSRSPVVTWQIFQFVAAVAWLQGGGNWLGILGLAGAAATFALCFAPSVNRALALE